VKVMARLDKERNCLGLTSIAYYAGASSDAFMSTTSFQWYSSDDFPSTAGAGASSESILFLSHFP